MTTASHAEPSTSAEPFLRLPKIPWPKGTSWFAFRTWVALALGLYVAFFFQLDGASSAGVCILILAQPAQGMVLSKSIYRLLGTIIGVVVSLVLMSLFPQDRGMLLASFAVFMALQTALGSVLRDFRSYACILAGYTVAIVAIANIESPDATFETAVNRVAAIVVGIAAIGFTNAVLATDESSKSLISKLRAATDEVVGLALDALDKRAPPDASTSVKLSAKLMPLRSEISFATPEKTNGRLRAKGARSALLGLFEMFNATQAVGTGLQNLKAPSPIVDEATALLRKALRLQNPDKCLASFDSLALPAVTAGTLSIEEAFALDRMRFMIETLGNVRDGLRSLRMGWRPRRDVRLDVHQDWFAVLVNAVRVVMAVGIIAILAIWSGLAMTNQAILFTAVFVSLGAVTPDPNIMGRAALFGMPAVIAVGAAYTFFILPNIEGYPLFILSLAPLVVAMCWFVSIGMPGVGLIFGVMSLVQISPANPQVYDPVAFVNSATMFFLSGIAIAVAFLLILPTQPAPRRLRLVLAVGRQLRNALADERQLSQPRASLQYDRLSQFKTWQRDETVTLARRKTMKRLVDIGNLAFAVRRAWRGLDAAKPFVDPATDARARKVLPSLSPAETLDLASAYLAAAKGREGTPAHCLVHCAAALYGTATVTRNEAHLLRRAELLNRTL